METNPSIDLSVGEGCSVLVQVCCTNDWIKASSYLGIYYKT